MLNLIVVLNTDIETKSTADILKISDVDGVYSEIVNCLGLPRFVSLSKGLSCVNNCHKRDYVYITQHSDLLINIGQQIESDALNLSLVNVILLQNLMEEFPSIVISKFNSNGVLTNWPFGIFDSIV